MVVVYERVDRFFSNFSNVRFPLTLFNQTFRDSDHRQTIALYFDNSDIRNSLKISFKDKIKYVKDLVYPIRFNRLVEITGILGTGYKLIKIITDIVINPIYELYL